MSIIKILPVFCTLLLMNLGLLAQKKTFDIATYTTPKSWTETPGATNISYSRIENGNWAHIVIYKSTTSDGTIDVDFDKDWNELVALNKSISAPGKTKPTSTGGWTVMSGSGTWEYNGANVTSQLTVYSNGRISISLLCNSTTRSLLNEFQTMLTSLTLNAGEATAGSNTSNVGVNGPSSANNISIAGVWVVNQAESNGFMNGHLMYTGGYMRKEYQFNKDGTYIFREKNWLAVKESIYFVNESGTWKLDGNKLTVTSKKGKAGWWNKDKLTNDVKKWGGFQKSAPYQIQTVTYNLEIKTDLNYGNSIILNSSKSTERDGGKLNDPPYRFVYIQRKETLIDNPPGWKL